MKLELKHIAPYVPYQLETTYNLSSVISLRDGVKDELRDKKLTASNLDFVCQFCKPKLRRLQDLLLPKWKDLENFDTKESQEEISNLANTNDLEWILSYTSYGMVEFLISNHFDVFGLIEKGLATELS